MKFRDHLIILKTQTSGWLYTAHIGQHVRYILFVGQKIEYYFYIGTLKNRFLGPSKKVSLRISS